MYFDIVSILTWIFVIYVGIALLLNLNIFKFDTKRFKSSEYVIFTYFSVVLIFLLLTNSLSSYSSHNLLLSFILILIIISIVLSIILIIKFFILFFVEILRTFKKDFLNFKYKNKKLPYFKITFSFIKLLILITIPAVIFGLIYSILVLFIGIFDKAILTQYGVNHLFYYAFNISFSIPMLDKAIPNYFIISLISIVQVIVQRLIEIIIIGGYIVTLIFNSHDKHHINRKV